jgi:hypothetical protein
VPDPVGWGEGSAEQDREAIATFFNLLCGWGDLLLFPGGILLLSDASLPTTRPVSRSMNPPQAERIVPAAVEAAAAAPGGS